MFSSETCMKRILHNYKAMHLFLINVLFVSVIQTNAAEFRDMIYLQSKTVDPTTSSQSIFDQCGLSITQCGSVCLLNQCCREFLYSPTSKRCVGLKFADFDIESNHLVISKNEGMRTYKKGTVLHWNSCRNLWCCAVSLLVF